MIKKSLNSKPILIFDFDGTLVDTFEIAFKCMNKLSKKYKFKLLNEKELKILRDKTFQNIIKEDLKLKWYQLPWFIRDVQKIMKDEIKTVNFHTDLIKILKELKKNHRLFILSSNHKDIIELELKKNKLDIFEGVYTNASIFRKEKSILKLAEMFNLDLNNAIYIGDEVRDIQASKLAKVRVASVTWGFNSKKILSLYNPEYIIENPIELLDLK